MQILLEIWELKFCSGILKTNLFGNLVLRIDQIIRSIIVKRGLTMEELLIVKLTLRSFICVFSLLLKEFF